MPTTVPAAALVDCWGGALAEGVPEGVTEAVPLEAPVGAPEADAVAEPVGTSVMVTPAAEQSFRTASATVLTSSAEQRVGVQVAMEPWIFSRPVVHWHLVSVTSQPDPGRAATKQGIAHEGMEDKSWAAARAKAEAIAIREKRIVNVCEVGIWLV
jgi:hypothetical protein